LLTKNKKVPNTPGDRSRYYEVYACFKVYLHRAGVDYFEAVETALIEYLEKRGGVRANKKAHNYSKPKSDQPK